jgi:hypothetical protein
LEEAWRLDAFNAYRLATLFEKAPQITLLLYDFAVSLCKATGSYYTCYKTGVFYTYQQKLFADCSIDATLCLFKARKKTLNLDKLDEIDTSSLFS